MALCVDWFVVMNSERDEQTAVRKMLCCGERRGTHVMTHHQLTPARDTVSHVPTLNQSR